MVLGKNSFYVERRHPQPFTMPKHHPPQDFREEGKEFF
jgi:hypothetical protein